MSAQLTFDAETHAYTLDGRKLPSVTEVCSVLDEWHGNGNGNSNSERAKQMREGRERGKYVHVACNLLVRNQLDWSALFPDYKPFVESAQRFLNESGIVITGSEVRVAHRTFGYAGTLDLTGMFRKHHALLDWKTGAFPRSVGPQTAAYKWAYEDMFPKQRIRRRYCVQLSPDLPNGYKVHALEDPADFQVFVSCLNIHRWRKNGS